MIDGIIALIIAFLTDSLLQPYFNAYIEYQSNRGVPFETFSTQLNLVKLAFQILAFLIVYGLIELIKHILNKKS